MPAGIFLLIQDVEILNGVGYTQAYNIYRDIRESLSKGPHQKITIEEYCNYHKVSRVEVEKALQQKIVA